MAAAGEGTDPYYYADNNSNNISTMADADVEDGIAIAVCYGVQENDAGDGVDCVRSSLATMTLFLLLLLLLLLLITLMMIMIY